MFKKIFKQLTQSREELYLETLEQSAAKIADQGSTQLAEVLRRFAQRKQIMDQQRASNDQAILPIDGLEELAVAICDGARDQIQDLMKIEHQLPDVITDCDPQRWTRYQQEWQSGLEALMRAFSALKHASTGIGSPAMDSIPLGDGKKSALDAAVESLDVEIRTALRIRNELG